MLFSTVEDYKASANYFSFDEHAIAYWNNAEYLAKNNIQHSDTTVLFLHGFPSASWDWHAQWYEIAKYYPCVAFDMLGFGLSDKPKTHHYSVLEQADICLRLCADLNINKVHIIAHDYGVSVAQELLHRFDADQLSLSINSICFLNGGLFVDTHRPLMTQRLLRSWMGPLVTRFMSKRNLAKSMTKIFGEKTPPSTHEIDVLWALLEYNNGQRILHKLLHYLDDRKANGKKWLDAMQATNVPLACINGLEDPVSGAHMLEAFQQRIPAAPTYALNVGHYPQLEVPEKVSELLLSYLRNKRFK